MKKILVFFLLIIVTRNLDAQQSCYQGLLNVAIKEYNSGKYENAIRNLNSAKKICKDANNEVIDDWISKANKKIKDRENKDSDDDGIIDRKDKCPYGYGLLKYGGCPTPDSDNDGYDNEEDRCPYDYSTKNDGCPIPDRDNDGFTDYEDKCPTEYSKENGGCPVLDSDNDGFSNNDDKCPTEYSRENHGCPVVNNGFGTKLYSNGTFHGNLLNGLRHGYGVFIWTDGEIYSGLWDNDDRTFGMYKWKSGNQYIGGFNNGNTNGMGRLRWNDGDEYIGEFKNNYRNGTGTYKSGSSTRYINNCPDCVKYIGGWKDSNKEGYGICLSAKNEILYEGEFKNDKPINSYPQSVQKRNSPANGYGIDAFSDGIQEGFFTNGNLHGLGTVSWNSGNEYTGLWDSGYRTFGAFKWKSGTLYVGQFKNKLRNGFGNLRLAEGDEYIGEFKDGNYNGTGTYQVGDPTSNKYLVNCPDCVKYIGGWKDDKKEGYGVCFNAKNEIIYQGEFRNDKPVSVYSSNK